MRELLDASRAAFPLAATRILQEPAAQNDSAAQKGYHYLVTILLTQDLLMPIFLDTAVPLPFCIWLAQTAAKIDARFYLRVSNALDDCVLDTNDPAQKAVTRVLEILSATMEPAAMGPLLRKILLHPSAQIRSKATLLIGRSQTGMGAIERLLPDEDPRVRANALESLWSNPDPRVIPMFLAGLNDANNRVIGNAILGLYAAGSTRAIAAAFDLSTHPDATFRGTAAWTMGWTGDPRFLPLLGKLVGESTGPLRKIVFQALQSIKKKNAARAECTMDVTVLSSYVDGERWRLRVGVKERSGASNTTLPATAFIVGTERESAADYASEPNGEKRLLMEFVIPSIDESAALQPVIQKAIANLRARKADHEQWRITEYSSPSLTQQSSRPFKFMGVEAPAIEEPVREKTPADLFGAICIAIENARPSPIPRHLVVLTAKCSPDLDPEDERNLLAACRDTGISLHVLGTSEDTRLKRISQRLAGSFRVLPSPEGIEEQLDQLLNCLTSHYAIDVPASFLEKKSSSGITVQVYAASGWGKCEAVPPL